VIAESAKQHLNLRLQQDILCVILSGIKKTGMIFQQSPGTGHQK
jgi:hypothetical protein